MVCIGGVRGATPGARHAETTRSSGGRWPSAVSRWVSSYASRAPRLWPKKAYGPRSVSGARASDSAPSACGQESKGRSRKRCSRPGSRIPVTPRPGGTRSCQLRKTWVPPPAYGKQNSRVVTAVSPENRANGLPVAVPGGAAARGGGARRAYAIASSTAFARLLSLASS